MDKDKEAFLKELRKDFKVEAIERLHAISNALLSLEKDFNHTDRQSIIEAVFREVHSMKGAARAVNLMQVERLCVSMESVLHEIKRETLSLSTQMFDVFFQTADLLETLVKEVDAPHKSISDNHINQVSKQLSALASSTSKHPQSNITKSKIVVARQSREKDPPGDASAEKTEPAVPDSEKTHKITGNAHSTARNGEATEENETVRVYIAKLYEILQRAEELISMKNELSHQAGLLQQISGQLSYCKNKYEARFNTIADDTTKRNKTAIAEEQEQLKKNQQDLESLTHNMDQLKRQTGRSIDELTHSIRKTLLQPFSSLFLIVSRIVRDLSKEYDKEAEVELRGSETEIDRRILEQLKNPIIHLIRNCLDHGIESRRERQKKKKPEKGKLRITVSSETGKTIKIELRDDGRGIKRAKLVESAIKSGVLTNADAEKMNDTQINRLIFSSGVTTSPFITDISGRGLGMAIVAEKIESLGGEIDVQSQPDQGTVFTITLPQTLSVFRGVLVKASENLFLMPTPAIERAILIKPEEISTVESKNTIKLGEERVGLVSLAHILGIPKRHSTNKRTSLQGLVFRHAQKSIVLTVEDILGEHEGLVKPLGSQLKHVKNITGVLLLGDGRIVPVLNIPEVLSEIDKKSQPEDYTSRGAIEKSEEEPLVKILVAEDSITVRNMLRNYLESAGFSVKTAVDGQQAFEFLQNQDFDIVVSDIEMPRMNGFELTERIRDVLGQMPVILVTALDSNDDRKRGMDAGANAYIVKSSFEKGNLIDTVKRLT